MTQEILALCRAMGAGQDQEELLLPLIQTVQERLAGRLREGVTAEDCGPAFPLAAAMTAMEHLFGISGGGEVASFTAGELTIRKRTGKSLSRQAQELLAPWTGGEDFCFRGVEG